MDGKIKVLIIDDSTLMREALRSIITSEPGMEIVGMARDGEEGMKKVFELKPDVITMDLKMPIMTGLEAIEEIMKQRPTPIVVVSSMVSNLPKE